MATTLTIKGQVTIPKHIRDALHLTPGSSIDFAIGPDGQVVIQKAGGQRGSGADRFQSARGKADIHWRTDELMALLRGET